MGEVTGTDKELLAALGKHLKANAELLEALLKKRSDQIKAIDKIEALALSASPFVNRTGGVRFLSAAAQTLKLLYDAGVFSEEAEPFINWLEEESESEEESDEE